MASVADSHSPQAVALNKKAAATVVDVHWTADEACARRAALIGSTTAAAVVGLVAAVVGVIVVLRRRRSVASRDPISDGGAAR